MTDTPTSGAKKLEEARRETCLESWAAACDLYSDALKDLSESKGEMSKDVGVIDIEFSQALIHAHRVEQDAEAAGGGEKEDEDESDAETEEANGTDDVKADGAEATTSAGASASAVEEGVASAAKNDDSSDDAVEELSKLDSAWELLEVARKIFSQEDDTLSKLRVIQIHQLLGEVCAELNLYDQAIGECQQAIEKLSSFKHLVLWDTFLRFQTAAYWLKMNDCEQAVIELDHVRYNPMLQDLQGQPQARDDAKDMKRLIEEVNSKIQMIETLNRESDLDKKERSMGLVMAELLQTAGFNPGLALYTYQEIPAAAAGHPEEDDEDNILDDSVDDEPTNMSGTDTKAAEETLLEELPSRKAVVTSDISHLVRRKEGGKDLDKPAGKGAKPSEEEEEATWVSKPPSKELPVSNISHLVRRKVVKAENEATSTAPNKRKADGQPATLPGQADTKKVKNGERKST